MGHKVANCPKATWNSRVYTQKSGTGIKPAAQRDRLIIGAPSGDNRSNQKPLTVSRNA